jgi:hypothetical protein
MDVKVCCALNNGHFTADTGSLRVDGVMSKCPQNFVR